jgi:hypothetical protein
MLGMGWDTTGLHEQNKVLVIGTKVLFHMQSDPLGRVTYNPKTDALFVKHSTSSRDTIRIRPATNRTSCLWGATELINPDPLARKLRQQ